jgi:hypothetical protein
MKDTRIVAAIVFLAGASLAWATPTVASLGSSITISDGNTYGSATTWYGNHEDNETEANPFTVKGQDWDLEGMYQNGHSLTLVGGYDFKYGNTYTDHHTYTSGDIFIDTNGTPNFTQANNGSTGLGGTVTDSFGYNYVIHFDATVSTYSVYKLTSTSVLDRTGDVQASNPWKYVSGGTAVAGYQNVAIGGFGLLDQSVYSNLTTFGSTGPGLLGYNASDTNSTNHFSGGLDDRTTINTMDNNHYYLTVDTSFLQGGKTATYHYTMECGNDNLMGQARTVPDSGQTLALFGLGLLPLLALRRKLGGR